MSLAQLTTFLLIGVGLSFDSFAVSVSFGLARKEIRFFQASIVALTFAFIQALFPVFGWLIGNSLKDLISRFDHWIAFGLLFTIGVKMIIVGTKIENALHQVNIFKPLMLLSLSIATSIDALVVGLSFGFLDMPIFLGVVIIGGVTFVACMLGMLFGKKIPAKRSRQSLIIGGIILSGIGIKILAEHLFGISF